VHACLSVCVSVCLSQTTTRALVTAASTTRRANRCLADTRAVHVLTDSPDSTANEVRIHPAVPSICRAMSRCSTHFTLATAVKFSWNPKESISIFPEIQGKFSLLHLMINWSATIRTISKLPSVLWRCWLGGRKGTRPVKTEWWGAGVVIYMEWGADLHHLCHCHSLSVASIKSILVLPFWYRLIRVVLDKRPISGRMCAIFITEKSLSWTGEKILLVVYLKLIFSIPWKKTQFDSFLQYRKELLFYWLKINKLVGIRILIREGASWGHYNKT